MFVTDYANDISSTTTNDGAPSPPTSHRTAVSKSATASTIVVRQEASAPLPSGSILEYAAPTEDSLTSIFARSPIAYQPSEASASASEPSDTATCGSYAQSIFYAIATVTISSTIPGSTATLTISVPHATATNLAPPTSEAVPEAISATVVFEASTVTNPVVTFTQQNVIIQTVTSTVPPNTTPAPAPKTSTPEPVKTTPQPAQIPTALPTNTHPANTQPANTQPAQNPSTQPANPGPVNTEPANSLPGGASRADTRPGTSGGARPTTPFVAPIITLAGKTYSAGQSNTYIIGSATLVPGGSPITVSSQIIWLGPSGTQLVVAPVSPTLANGSPAASPVTYQLAPIAVSAPGPTGPVPVVATLGSGAVTLPPGASSLVVTPTPGRPVTLYPGSPPVTLSGTVLSLASGSSGATGGPVLVVGTGTAAQSFEIPAATPQAASFAPITIMGPGNDLLVISPSHPLVIAGTTIYPGAPAEIVQSTPVSLALGSSILVIGSSTITILPTQSGADGGIGSYVWSGLGGTVTGTMSGSNSAYTGPPYLGEGDGKPGPGLIQVAAVALVGLFLI